MSDTSNAPVPPSDPVLDQYLAGEAGADQRARVDEWRAASPLREAMVGALGEVLPGWYRVTAPIDVDDAVRRITARRAASSGESAPRPTYRGALPRLTRRWEWVAGFGTAAMVAITLFIQSMDPAPAATERRAKSYSTGAGQTAVLRLGDGTRITLAPQTTLGIEQGFGEAHRAVTLTGEAYFDVARAAGRPFTVRAGGVTSRVLGTQFTVRHYAADSDVRVAVASGRVMSGRHAPVVLTSRMVARFTDSTLVVGTGADLREYVEWTSGRLAFSRAPLAEVVEVLGRWYGLEFRFADPALASRHVTAVFDYNARQEVFQTLELMLGVHMTFQDTVVTLVPGRAARSRPTRRTHDEASAISTEVGR